MTVSLPYLYTSIREIPIAFYIYLKDHEKGIPYRLFQGLGYIGYIGCIGYFRDYPPARNTRLERFTEVREFTYLGKHFPCVNAN